MTSIYGRPDAVKRKSRTTPETLQIMDEPAATEYVDRASLRIVELIEAEHAVVHSEIEAKLAEGYYRDSGRNIDPHHLTTALRHLSEQGTLTQAKTTTRGGRSITTITLTAQMGLKTRTAQAARRKRLLLARYFGWAQGTKRDPQGLIGPAGEAAVRGGIIAAGTIIPAAPNAGEVKQLLGVPLPGALDSAGHMLPVRNGVPQPLDEHGNPNPTVTIAVEVKNIRSWIYPVAGELYQLLSKATLLQTARPQAQIVPILICRRAHTTTFYMAKQLGFLVIDLEAQYVGPVSVESINEVRNELGFTDLRSGTGPSLRVAERLSTSKIPALLPGIAEAWQATALDTQTAQTIAHLHKSNNKQRFNGLETLRNIAQRRGLQGGW